MSVASTLLTLPSSFTSPQAFADGVFVGGGAVFVGGGDVGVRVGVLVGGDVLVTVGVLVRVGVGEAQGEVPGKPWVFTENSEVFPSSSVTVTVTRPALAPQGMPASGMLYRPVPSVSSAPRKNAPSPKPVGSGGLSVTNASTMQNGQSASVPVIFPATMFGAGGAS